jgi:hypothetical protein
MKSCETCIKRSTCTRDTGIIFGGCNVEYEADLDVISDDYDSQTAEQELISDEVAAAHDEYEGELYYLHSGAPE